MLCPFSQAGCFPSGLLQPSYHLFIALFLTHTCTNSQGVYVLYNCLLVLQLWIHGDFQS